MEFAAIVLAGGRSSRMRRAKQGLKLDGRTLLQRAVDACADCGQIAVVADSEQAKEWIAPDPRVVVTLEDPPDGGPVAGLAAGLAALRLQDGDGVVVIACDLPRVDELMSQLLAHAAHGDHDAVVPQDSQGWPQWLAAWYRVGPLRSALGQAQELRNVSVRRVLGGIEHHSISLPDQLLGDVDDPEQARAAGIEV